MELFASFLKLFLLNFATFSPSESDSEVCKVSMNFQNFSSCLAASGVTQSNLVTPANSSAEYTQLNTQWNIRGEVIQPLAYLVPDNVTEIQVAVKCARAAGAGAIRLVPRSGGHSYTKLGFGDSASVVVDLRKLNAVTVDQRTKLGTVGAGANIGMAAYEFWANGELFTPLGICATVGISGVALGGGFGFYSRTYGLTTDNVVEMELVDADGQLRVLNKDSHSDLFWAMRGAGGSGSYGIVTSFTFQLYPAPAAIVDGSISYHFSDFPAVFSAYQRWFSNSSASINGILSIKKDTVSIMFVHIQTHAADEGGGVASAVNGTAEAEIEQLLDTFPTPPISRSIETYSYLKLLIASSNHGGYNEFIRPNVNVTVPADIRLLTYEGTMYMKAKSLYISKELSLVELEELQQLFSKLLPKCFIFFEPYGGAINNLSNEETAFVHRGSTRYQLALYYRGLAEESDQLYWLNHVFEASRGILNHTESYQNYLDDELEAPLERYYGKNLARLIQIKMVVDPTNFFHGPQSIPTKKE